MTWRATRLATLLDVVLVLFITATFERDVVGPEDFFGTHVAGPRALTVTLPLLFAVPLLWRRRWPLATGIVALAGMSAQALASGNTPEGLEYIALWILWPYGFAAYAGTRRALIGLVVTLGTYGVYAANNHDITSGRVSEQWAGAFFLILAVGAWLAGAAMRARQERAALHAHAEAIEQQAQQAVDEERARIARELHDIVAHNLSVVVVQAAGAQALAGDADPQTSALAKIERSGREALVEMRRLLGVLRRDDGAGDIAPSPGAADLPALVDRLRAAGMHIELDLVGEPGRLPAAVGQSAYRIVQESLTNALKHAGHDARVQVWVIAEADACSIEVTDDGAGHRVPPQPTHEPGHGLIGMRERAEVFGGEVSAGPRAGASGYVVRARLPLDRGIPA